MDGEELQARENNGNDRLSGDPTAPVNETEVFHSIWEAVRWKQIRARVPVCFKKTIRSRYMLANLVYLGYAIGILIIDFNPVVNGTADSNVSCPAMAPALNDTLTPNDIANKMYLGLGVVHIVSAFLYWWAWADRYWSDIIMIPEYLNHIEAALYIWSASWYSREDTYGGDYTLAVHRIEMTAATVELIASFGWIMSWYMTYTRTLGRGFTLDDPDVIGFSATTISSFVYMVYNVQINVDPTQYGSNTLYTYGDIVYFVGACYYIFASMRDDHWFWFLPLGGQYAVPAGKVHVETKVLPQFGRPAILMTACCKRPTIKPQKTNQEEPQLI